MRIKQIYDKETKQTVTRCILESLPEWFGIPETREEYIRDSGDKIYFCACDGSRPVGFLYLKETGKDTVELAVTGVLKEYHRRGIGRELFGHAKRTALEMGYP